VGQRPASGLAAAALPLAWALFALLRRRRAALAQLVDPALLGVLAPAWNPARAKSRLVLRVLALALLDLALARPQWASRWEESAAKDSISSSFARHFALDDGLPTSSHAPPAGQVGIRDLLRNLRGRPRRARALRRLVHSPMPADHRLRRLRE
jgi:hypothetical protein